MPLPEGTVLASLGSRFKARLIDIFAVFLLNVVANGWFAYLFVQSLAPYWRAVMEWNAGGGVSDPPVVPDRVSNLIFVMLLVLIAVWGAYEIPGTANTGQTLGKRLLHIKVASIDPSQQLGVGRSIRRWANMSLPVLLWQCCGIGLILQAIDAFTCVVNKPYQQCIHDRAVRTVVVQVDASKVSATSHAATVSSDSSEGERP